MTIRYQKTSYLGHILRGDKYRLLQLILKGKIEGRRGVGRSGCHGSEIFEKAGELFHMAEERSAFAIMKANVRMTGQGT